MNLKVNPTMNTNSNTKEIAKDTQLGLHLEHGGERSDYAPCNRLVNTWLALPSWLVITLLDEIETCDQQTFNYAGCGGLTWKEWRDKFLEALK